LYEGTEYSKENPTPGWLVSWPRPEHGTSQIRNGNANQLTTTLGVYFKYMALENNPETLSKGHTFFEHSIAFRFCIIFLEIRFSYI
jgi:hypothetical protein